VLVELVAQNVKLLDTQPMLKTLVFEESKEKDWLKPPAEACSTFGCGEEVGVPARSNVTV